MKLAEYLAEKGLNHREFADRIGVSAEAVRLYLTGDRTPRRGVVQAIAAQTDGRVTANDFFMQEGAAQ
jgi:predicted transcriptional regulator